MPTPGYTTVSVPRALHREIAQVVTDRRHGYRSVSEFIREAVRLHLERVVRSNLEGLLVSRIEAAVYR